MFEKDFALYEHLKGTNANYKTPYYLVCFGCIDAFVDNPTREEYEVIADICYELYLKLDDVNLENIADSIAKNYADRRFTLQELKKMDRWQICQFII